MKLNWPRLCWLSTLVLMFVTTEGSRLEHRCHNYTTYYGQRRMRIYDFMSMNGSIITRLPGNSYYDSGLKCKWYLDAGAFGRVKLTFIKVDLRRKSRNEKCSEQDHLLIQNSLGRYDRQVCPGTHAEQFISIGRGTYLTFHSDSREYGFHHKGIEIKYEMFEPGKQKCPPGWVCGPENKDGTCSCYHIMRGPNSMVDFQTAQKFCGFSNANLVKIDSTHMHDFIQGLVAKFVNMNDFWIGLNDIEKEGTFEWIDRSSLFFDHRRKENSLTRNCVIQEVSTGSWFTVPCDEPHFYICEIFSMFDTTVYLVPKRTALPDEVDKFYILKVTAGVGGAILVVIICCCYCCCCRKSNKSNQPTGQSSNTSGDQVASQNFIPPPPTEPTAPPLSELQPMSPQICPRDPDGLPSYEECMGLPERA